MFIMFITNLLEADIICILPEALSAHVEAIFSDQPMTVGADTTEKYITSLVSKDQQTSFAHPQHEHRNRCPTDVSTTNFRLP